MFHREAYHESVILGQELSLKMNEDVSGNAANNQDGASDYEDEDEEQEGGKGKKRGTSTRAAQALHRELEGGGDGGEGPTSGRYKKLFEMDFMKRAVEQQKEKAREEAQSILKEIEEMEGPGADSDDDEDNDPEAVAARQAASAQAQQRLAQAKQEVRDMVRSNKGAAGGSSMSALALTLGNTRKGKKLQSAGINLDGDISSSSSSKDQAAFAYADVDNEVAEQEQEQQEVAAAEAANPWLQPMATTDAGSKKRKVIAAGTKTSSSSSSSSHRDTNDEVFVDVLKMKSKDSSAVGTGKTTGKNVAHNTLSLASTSSSAIVGGVVSEDVPLTKKQKKMAAAAAKNASSGVIVESAAPQAGKTQEGKAVSLSLSEGRSQVR
jgi:hypothetical protein